MTYDDLKAQLVQTAVSVGESQTRAERTMRSARHRIEIELGGHSE